MKPIPKGHDRAFKKCTDCGEMAYYDYVPYSLSDPFYVMPCKHYNAGMEPVTEAEYMKWREGKVF